MWLADVCPRNSESMAINYAVKYIRRASQASLGYSLSPTNGVEGLASFIRPQTFFISGATSVHFISSTAITTHNILMTAHRKSGVRACAARK